jgi:hypothetical protein
MKKSSVLGVLAAVILSLFLTGCESAEEKQARLQKIERLQLKIEVGEKKINVDKDMVEIQKRLIEHQEQKGTDSSWEKNELISLEKNLKEAEERLEQNKAKLKELQK